MTKVYKEGCSIGVALDMTEEDGVTIISEMTVRWYGFKRDMGNAATRDLVDTLEAQTVKWEDMRNELQAAAEAAEAAANQEKQNQNAKPQQPKPKMY